MGAGVDAVRKLIADGLLVEVPETCPVCRYVKFTHWAWCPKRDKGKGDSR